MRKWQLSEIRAKLVQDLDLEDEDFVRAEEITSMVNEGIDVAEALIHSMYEDYFLTKSTLSLVADQQDYSLPTEIYASKIRGVIYANGDKIYTVKQIKNIKTFEHLAVINRYGTTDDFRYVLTNSLSDGVKMSFYPTPKASESDVVTVWHIRNSKRLVNESDECDIPEFVNFVIQFAKVRIYEKERSELLPKAAQDLEQLRALMVNTLTTMVPDGDNEIERDISVYEEMN